MCRTFFNKNKNIYNNIQGDYLKIYQNLWKIWLTTCILIQFLENRIFWSILIYKN